MIKKLISLLLIVLCLNCFSVSAISVTAKSAILVEQNTGRIIFEQNAHQKMKMASTTKILTGLIAIEAGSLDRRVVVTKPMVTVEGTSMGLVVGDTVSLEGLLYGLLLQSGNDAANTIAIYLSGSIEKFSVVMNKRAKEIGLLDSNFITPSGLDDKEHYTTAYDMALLTATAMRNPKFAEIVSSKKATIEFGNPVCKRTYVNHNKLLDNFEGIDGVKTGFTKKAGRCLVTSCTRNNIRLIAVTLNASDDWNNHKSLFEYGFSLVENYHLDTNVSGQKVRVAGGNKKVLFVSAKAATVPLIKGEKIPIKRKLLLPHFVFAPINKGEQVGSIEYSINGRVIAVAPVTANEDVFKSDLKESSFFDKMFNNFLTLIRC